VAPTEKVAVGKMVPQPMVTDSEGNQRKLDSFLGSDFCVIGINVDPRTVMTDAQQAAWAIYAPRYLTVLSRGKTATSADQLVDVENVLVPWFGKYGVSTAVLRSDKYVAATNNTSLEMARIWK
jgi:3-(3-hydroxy-phenyl)propionate hydroxylase